MGEGQNVRDNGEQTRDVVISAMATGTGPQAAVIPIQSTIRVINPPDQRAAAIHVVTA